MRKLILALTCLFYVIPCGARTIIVKADGSGDYPTIQAAINDANNGDTVVLQPGTYTGPGNRDIDFLGKAITVRSTDPNDPNIIVATIIDCEGDWGDYHRGFYFHSGEDNQSLIEGFTVTGGFKVADPGAGIFCENSSPTIRNCIIEDNTSLCRDYTGTALGGGIYCDNASPIIHNCTISSNEGGEGGGGIFCCNNSCPEITSCAIRGNWSFTPIMTGVGGGMYNLSSNPILTNCTFSGNSAPSGGGMFNSNSNPILNNCTFSGNAARYTDEGNFGGGMYTYNSKPVLTNCIFWGNSDDGGTDESAQIHTIGVGGPIINYSCVQGWTGGFGGTGNIGDDPCFADPCNSDYHLKSELGRWDPNSQSWVIDDVTSPAIDAGDPNSDWSQEPCPNGGRINMGAYGGTAQASMGDCFPYGHPDYSEWVSVGKPPCWCYPRQCHGDTDDCKEYACKTYYYYCHAKDLSVLLNGWNVREPPEGPGIGLVPNGICADFDHDTEFIKGKGYYRVHSKDLSILVANWNVREPPYGPGIEPNCLDVP